MIDTPVGGLLTALMNVDSPVVQYAMRSTPQALEALLAARAERQRAAKAKALTQPARRRYGA